MIRKRLYYELESTDEESGPYSPTLFLENRNIPDRATVPITIEEGKIRTFANLILDYIRPYADAEWNDWFDTVLALQWLVDYPYVTSEYWKKETVRFHVENELHFYPQRGGLTKDIYPLRTSKNGKCGCTWIQSVRETLYIRYQEVYSRELVVDITTYCQECQFGNAIKNGFKVGLFDRQFMPDVTNEKHYKMERMRLDRYETLFEIAKPVRMVVNDVVIEDVNNPVDAFLRPLDDDIKSPDDFEGVRIGNTYAFA